MEESYEVSIGAVPVGKVLLYRQGLYLRIVCRCQIPETQVYRLYAVTEGKRENLGVVVPEGDGFFLDKKIPAKRLGPGKVQFLLSARGEEKRGEYSAIYPEEPFWYIEGRKAAFLQNHKGK